jgi:hypothetical protein
LKYYIAMKGLLALLVLLAVSQAFVIGRLEQFRSYAEQYGKRYESKAVELYRFGIYLKNLAIIEALNNNPEDSALYG